MNVLNGFVEMEDSMGNDLAVVNAARVSFNKKSHTISDEDHTLIEYLMYSGHGSPFEHVVFKFHISTPIFVAREWMRHRIGSFNEQSARYTTIDDKFYQPDYIRTQVGRPGEYSFQAMSEGRADEAKMCISSAYMYSYDMYEKMLSNGVAKEVARMVLPVGIMTEFYWTVNARSLMNFISLRNDSHAQYEIREYAKIVETYFEDVMPITYKYFIANGRMVP